MKEKYLISKHNNSHLTIGYFGGGEFSEYESNIWKGIVRASEKNNINLLSFAGGELKNYDNNWQQYNFIYELININKIDGLIIPSTCFSNYLKYDELIAFLKRFYPLPIVSIATEIKFIPSILVNNKKGMQDLIIHLIKVHKYRRIAFIRGPKTNPEAEERFKVYEDVLNKYNIPIDNRLITQGDFFLGSGSGGKEINVFFDERKVSFEALVCCNDVMARNAIKELNRRGLRVPDDIAVTGFDDTEESSCLSPPLTTVNQPVYKLGEEAVNILLCQINKQKFSYKIVLPTELIVRQSCGCFTYPGLKLINKNSINKTGIKKIEKLNDIIINEIKKDNESNIIMLRMDSKNPEWLIQLLNTMLNKKKSVEKSFLKLERLILEGVDIGIDILSWNSIISIIFKILKKLDNYDIDFFNNLHKSAYIIIGNIAERIKKYLKIQYRNQEYQISRISNLFISCFEIEKFKKLIVEYLPDLKINSCYISFFEGKQRKYARLLVGYDKKNNINMIKKRGKFLSYKLVPDNIKFDKSRHSYIVMPLIYNNIKKGFVLFEIDDIEKGGEYFILQVQLTNALHGIELMSKIKKHTKELEEKIKERTIRLEAANEKLKKLDELKNDFIANITHDFRSPLTTILNITDLALKFDIIDDEIKENYYIIYKSSLRLKGSIDKLLELAKMDAQGIKLKVKKMELISFINKVLDYYSSSVTISEIKIIRKIPEVEIENFYTDAEKLEEIIDNIISNAIKFVDPKIGIITCELEEHNNTVVISITDNGIGIPKDKLEAIFNRFEQVHSGRNSPYKGTGIGLAFAKQLVEYLKGNIWAESEGEGKGSKFIIELKKGRNIFDEKDFSDEPEKQIKLEYRKILIKSELEEKLEEKDIEIYFNDLNKENEYDYKKGIILIVDDDKNIREIVRKYLRNYGYKNFILTANGKKGLESVYEYSPDIIICDYNMPVMKGDEFHNQIINNPKFKEIPFIFLSAITDERLIVERREKGANAYLKKPIDEKIFIITIEEHIKKYFNYLKIIQMAITDELTGLNNRRAIITSLNHELAIRKYRDLSLIFFDIDHFKEINDTYGHQNGDMILSTIGGIVKSSIRSYDISGRYGGDEFIIILLDTNLEEAKYVAEILRKKIENNNIRQQERDIYLSASFGISSLKNNAEYIEKKLNIDNLENLYNISNSNDVNWEEIEKSKMHIADLLFKMADIALYKAKQTTCNKCKFSSEKSHDFKNNKCPKCDSYDLILGRNKVVIFNSE